MVLDYASTFIDTLEASMWKRRKRTLESTLQYCETCGTCDRTQRANRQFDELRDRTSLSRGIWRLHP